MNPQIDAAVIAASVSVLTLIGTIAAQHFGRRATSWDTHKALEEQGIPILFAHFVCCR
jgi:hypothetical protein